MISVISQNKWLRWCHEQELDVTHARFALETCYYGVDLRSRPGTLLVTDRQIVHASYSSQDAVMAAFESRIKVEMPVEQIVSVRRSSMTLLLKVMQLSPDAYFQVEMRDGTVHHLILQRDGDAFEKAVATLEIVAPATS